MAKTIQLIEVAPPTGVTATLEAGGSLPVGTTYYYRFISLRRYDSSTNVLSEPTAEVTVTTSAGNQQVKLDWTAAANATGVIIQRTTTSGSYPVGSQQSFSNYERSGYSVYPFAWTGTNTLTDAGGTTTGDVGFFAPNLDHSKAYPTIEISSDANDTITMQDIYLADVAGGWGLVDKICPTDLKGVTTAALTDELPYMVDGCIYAKSCIFQLRGMLIFKQGCLTNATSVTFKYGVSDAYGNTMPYIFSLVPFYIGYTSDGVTIGGYPYMLRELYGTPSSFAYNLIKRPILAKVRFTPYLDSTWDDGIDATGCTVKKCMLGLKAGNGMPVRAATYEDNIFEGMRHNYSDNEIADATVRWAASDGLSQRWADNTIFVRPRTTKCKHDSTIGHQKGALQIDPTYGAYGQTDNQPYFYSGNSQSVFIGNTLVIGFTIGLTIVDVDGNAISGATVAIKDKNGYSDLWEDSGATISSVSLTTTTTSAKVSNGALFTIGDIIRIKQYAERYEITNIVGNVLTFTRAAQGTTARATQARTLIIYKQVQSLTTNASGDATPTEYLTGRELACAKDGGSYGQSGYENDLVTAGWLARAYFTPHTVTISKTGYQTKTMVLDMDRKREEVVVLEKTVPIYNDIERGLSINIAPTNGQNSILLGI